MITDIAQGLNSNHKVQSSNLKVQSSNHKVQSSMFNVQSSKLSSTCFFVVWNKNRNFAAKLLYNKVLEKDDYTFKPCYPIRQESSIQGR